MPVSQLVKDSSIDFSWIIATLVAWLPIIQGVLSIGVVLLVFLIQLHRYRKLNKKSNEQEEKKS